MEADGKRPTGKSKEYTEGRVEKYVKVMVHPDRMQDAQLVVCVHHKWA